MKRVIIESPYADNVPLNLRYLRACLRDSLLRGEAPYASHALYTQPGVLDDTDPGQRAMGINAGFAWRGQDTLTALYTDLGMSRGMQLGAEHVRSCDGQVEERSIGHEALEIVRRDEGVPGFVESEGTYTMSHEIFEALSGSMSTDLTEIHVVSREKAERIRMEVLALFSADPR